MATGAFEGTNFALQDTPVVGTIPRAAYAGGIVYCQSDDCFVTGTDLDAGSTFKIAKLPKGAAVLKTVIWAIDTATFGAPDAMTNAVTGVIGITGDTDLFGDVSALNATTVQTVAPKPDGTTFTTLLTNGLQSAVDVFLTTAAAAVVATEGIHTEIYYTVAAQG